MAKAAVGTLQADWDTKLDLVFPPVSLSDRDGYYFFIETVPRTLVLRKQYLLLFARYTAASGDFESPLIIKAFANGFPTIFAVPVPDSSLTPNPTQVRIIARPKEFFPGSGTQRVADILVSRETANDIPNITVTL